MSIGHYIALYAGGLATFASPCVLPMLPLYLGVLAGAQASGGEATSKRRLRLAGVGFALGLGLVFVLMGMGATALTQTLSGHRRMFEVGAGVVMMLFGAKLLGWLHLSWFDREARPLLNRVPNVGGFTGGLLFGAGFAVGWTPCVGPVLATALTYAASSTSSPLVAGGMLAVYALGLATPLIVASFAASRLLVFTQRLRKYTPVMQRTTGALLLALGTLFATDQLSKLSPNLATSSDCTGATTCETKIAPVHPEVNVEALPRGPALVEFESGHCSVCKKMHPLVSDLEQRCTLGLIVRVNVDDPSGRQLAAHYGVSMVPTFVSIDPSGGEVERIIGEQSKERLILALNDLGGKPCEHEM
jgi:cytochrome c-type biogenesis protein